MNIKIKIRFYFLTKNYTNLKRLIIEHEEALKYLNEKEIEILLEYAATNQDFILFNTILLDLSNEESETKQEIIEKYLKKYLPMFFHNFVFLYSIANMISKNPTKYQEEINEIKAFILISPLNEITVYIHNLEGFYSKEMEEKILSSKNTRFLFCLLESSNEETTKRILNEIMESKPNSEKIYRLARMLNKNEEKLDELKTMIFDLDVPKQTKGKYLLAFYEGIKNVKNELDSFAIIDEIVLLNDFDTTNKLMSRLNEETKRTIITRYFHSTNKKLIFTLACTADCEETTLLINRILLDIKEEEVFSLIMFVKEKYLPLIFKKVLKDEKAVLKLINNLYLFGSNRWMNIINYITEVDYDIISPSKIKEMTSFMEKEETKASRKRSLT